jgi:hypothetical protein
VTRLPLIGALAAGLLIGALPPAVANASVHHVNKLTARTRALDTAAHTHAGPAAPSHVGTAARSHVAGINAPSAAKPVPQGSSLGPVPVAQSLLFLPQVMGVVDRHQ